MAEDLGLTMGTTSPSSAAHHWESFWKCCQCEQNGAVGILTPLDNNICRNGHQRCDNCPEEQAKTLGAQNTSENKDSRSADVDDEYLLKHISDAPRRRPRAASFGSNLKDRQRRQPHPSLSPLASWDDSALNDKHYVALSIPEDQFQRGESISIALRRTANINVFDDSDSDSSLCSRPSSLVGNDSENELLEERFVYPVKYFQELDDLGSKIYKRSMFSFYIGGKAYLPFDGNVRFAVPFFENASFPNYTYNEVLGFCTEVINLANEYLVHAEAPSHYVDKQMYHQQITELVHLIECRNVISVVWENIKEMKAAHYCGDFISSLVLDRTRPSIARLVRIECSIVEQLAIAFETSLLRIMSCDPAMVLLNIIPGISSEVSAACREVLNKLSMNIPDLDSKDIWRCTVHILDVIALSYMGAHTQFLGSETITSVALPGSFLEKQYFRFCRRTFSCLNEFLGGQEAWVLEPYHAYPMHIDLPPLTLLTDAETFGDIWGPIWKSCIPGHEDQIIQYSVGNGVIVPWNQATLAFQDTIEVRKGEIFCHWMSEKEVQDPKSLTNSSTLHEKDLILIGAPVRLHPNNTCRASTTSHRQRLRNSGSLTEPGTKKNGRILDSEIFQIQVTPPYMGFVYQRQYKLRGRPMIDDLIKRWKNSPNSRQVRCLEFKLGLQVSTCNYNARRIRLIELFGTKTMLNYLRNASIQWESVECQESFYSALQSTDYTAFRRLCMSQPSWQSDLGRAIECCFDALMDTGKIEKDLALFWAPDDEPGEKVILKSNELSWIGFLEETETSGTLAVLDDSCLELPGLEIGRKCASHHFDPRHISSGLSMGYFDVSILETSAHLNELCVPDSIRQGRVRSKRHDGRPSRYPYRWSLFLLEEGDKFDFGEKGILKAITPLTQGQILAKRSSLDIRHQLQMVSSKIPVLGGTANIHYECIRDSKEDTSPVSFIILSTAKTMPHSARVSRQSSIHATSSSPPQSYHFDPRESGLPRSMARTSKPVLSQSEMDELRDIINRWKAQPQMPAEWARQEWQQ